MNIGNQHGYDFSLMPEFGTDLSWQFMPNLKARVGYSILCLNRVARAGDQIDTGLNPNLFPPAVAGATPNSPVFNNARNDVWIQTINLGLEWDF